MDPSMIGAIAGGVVAGAASAGALGWRLLSGRTSPAHAGPTEEALEAVVVRAINGMREDVSDIKRTIQHEDHGNIALHHRVRNFEKQKLAAPPQPPGAA